MAIPKAVQAQVDAAEKIHKAVYGSKPQQDAQEDKGDAPSSDESKESVESKPTDEATTQDTDNTETSSEQASEPERGKRREPFEKDDAAAWKARYFSFQGNHRQMVAGLQQQIDDLKQQLEDSKSTKPEPQPEATPQRKRVTEKDVEEFGPDLIDVIHRKAQEVAEEAISTLQTQHKASLDKLQAKLDEANSKLGNVERVQTESAEVKFYGALESGVGDWEKVQATEECQEWLGSKIPGTTFTWDDALKDAAGRLDGERAVEVFREFFRAYPELDGNRKTKTRQESSDLQRQVAPPKSVANPTPQKANGKRIFTAAEFEAESNRIIRLSKQGKYDEAAHIESELNAAMSEGRVRP